jgi:hypothetical protein
MLPPGLVAQPADRHDQQLLLARHPDARTVVRLLVGACSCDLVRPRHTDRREDERHHRDRFRHAGGSRAALLETLDQHRRGGAVRPPPGGWPRALAAFVAEHARNAGETLYLLRFSTGTAHVPAEPAPPRQTSPAELDRRVGSGRRRRLTRGAATHLPPRPRIARSGRARAQARRPAPTRAARDPGPLAHPYAPPSRRASRSRA